MHPLLIDLHDYYVVDPEKAQRLRVHKVLLLKKDVQNCKKVMEKRSKTCKNTNYETTKNRTKSSPKRFI